MLQVFNSNTKYLQKERAASDAEASRKVDYLRDEVAARLCDRLLVRSLPHNSTNLPNLTVSFSDFHPKEPPI